MFVFSACWAISSRSTCLAITVQTCETKHHTTKLVISFFPLPFQSVSAALGTGKIKYFNKEEALLQKDIEQADFDMLLVNLRMDAVYVKENMRIRWAGEMGLVDSIQNVVKEYKETRGLTVSMLQSGSMIVYLGLSMWTIGSIKFSK
jgi:hypothetical protein